MIYGVVLPKNIEVFHRGKWMSFVRGLGDLFSEDFFPEVRELSLQEKAESEARSKAWRFLESQRPG